MGSGRSDYPNQVNNVLGFPFIFRGALDVPARFINEEMKMAAACALAELAKEEVPDKVRRAYGGQEIAFGPDYIIPKPFDPRVLTWVAPAVAKAACETGVAQVPIEDWDAYKEQLAGRISRGREAMRTVIRSARRRPARIVFPEAEEEKVLRACEILVSDGIAQPVLVGNGNAIRAKMAELNLDLGDVEIVDVESSDGLEQFGKDLWDLRQRKGMTPQKAQFEIHNPLVFGCMMVRRGGAEGLVCGLNRSYPETIRPALQIIGLQEGASRVCGMYMIALERRALFFADATVNIE
ncbi:MAG: phosphate acyltransferase, partial [Planctomycetota bacterium]